MVSTEEKLYVLSCLYYLDAFFRRCLLRASVSHAESISDAATADMMTMETTSDFADDALETVLAALTYLITVSVKDSTAFEELWVHEYLVSEQVAQSVLSQNGNEHFPIPLHKRVVAQLGNLTPLISAPFQSNMQMAARFNFFPLIKVWMKPFLLHKDRDTLIDLVVRTINTKHQFNEGMLKQWLHVIDTRPLKSTLWCGACAQQSPADSVGKQQILSTAPLLRLAALRRTGHSRLHTYGNPEFDQQLEVVTLSLANLAYEYRQSGELVIDEELLEAHLKDSALELLNIAESKRVQKLKRQGIKVIALTLGQLNQKVCHCISEWRLASRLVFKNGSQLVATSLFSHAVESGRVEPMPHWQLHEEAMLSGPQMAQYRPSTSRKPSKEYRKLLEMATEQQDRNQLAEPVAARLARQP